MAQCRMIAACLHRAGPYFFRVTLRNRRLPILIEQIGAFCESWRASWRAMGEQRPFKTIVAVQTQTCRYARTLASHSTYGDWMKDAGRPLKGPAQEGKPIHLGE